MVVSNDADDLKIPKPDNAEAAFAGEELQVEHDVVNVLPAMRAGGRTNICNHSPALAIAVVGRAAHVSSGYIRLSTNNVDIASCQQNARCDTSMKSPDCEELNLDMSVCVDAQYRCGKRRSARAVFLHEQNVCGLLSRLASQQGPVRLAPRWLPMAVQHRLWRMAVSLASIGFSEGHTCLCCGRGSKPACQDGHYAGSAAGHLCGKQRERGGSLARQFHAAHVCMLVTGRAAFKRGH
eukprot:364639-Chlamydomonas_euryale.AAC.14